MTKRSWFLLALLLVVAAAALVFGDRERPAAETGDPESVLRSLPYLAWVPTGESEGLSGVTVHDPGASWAGLNLYSPREAHRAFLLDMQGNVLHRWDAALQENDMWQLVEPLADGELLVINANRQLLRIDRHSRILWVLERRVHHDVAIAESGALLVLAREERVVERPGGKVPILDDVILRVSPAGEVDGKLSIYDLFADRVPEHRWAVLERWYRSEQGMEDIRETVEKYGFRLENGSEADLFHTNSIEILPRPIPGISEAGALLISIRELSLVAIVDFVAARTDWHWGPGVVRRQHHPSLLDNGNLLVFDNLGGRDGASRVLEVDPVSRQVVWEYNGDPPASFFSAVRGGCQRLPNGNTLITESDRGRVFEIDPGGRVVWEYYNPFTRDGGKERSAIYRMTRLAPDGAPWLADPAPRGPDPQTRVTR